MINQAKGQGDLIAQHGMAEGEEVKTMKTVRTVKTRGERKEIEKGRKSGRLESA
jgi:hypothetical protein